MKKTLCAALLAAVLLFALAGCNRQSFEGEWELEGVSGHFSAVIKNFDDEYLLSNEEFLQETYFQATVDVKSFTPAAGSSAFQLVMVLPGSEYVVLYDSARDGAPYQGGQQVTVPTGLTELKLVGACKEVELSFAIEAYDPYR